MKTQDDQRRNDPRESQQFDAMGHSYIGSLDNFPDAREEELTLLMPDILRASGAILDYAAGNGFVTERILASRPRSEISEICGVDSSQTMLLAYRDRFAANPAVGAVLAADFVSQHPERRYDLCLSLGGLHHIADQIATLRAIRERMHPGAPMVFADFEDGTTSQRYFDELIHPNNGYGHIALFVSESRAVNLARASGSVLVRYRRSTVDWRCSSKESLLGFVCQHHGLTCGPAIVEAFLEDAGLYVEDGSMYAVRHHYATIEFRA